MTSYKNICIYLFSLMMSFSSIGCKKGELMVEQELLARIAFRSYSGENLNIRKVSIDGKSTIMDKGTFQFILDQKDSADVIAYDDKDNVLIQQRLALRIGANVFGVYPKSPLDPTLVVGKNPLEETKPIEGTYQFKLLNYNKIISPNGEPIRLAIYKGTLVYDEETFSEEMVFEAQPLVTTDLITDKIPDNYIELPITTFYRATVLDKNGNPLLIEGQNVFIYPRISALLGYKSGIFYLPNKEADVIFEDDWTTMVDGLGFELSDIWLKQ